MKASVYFQGLSHQGLNQLLRISASSADPVRLAEECLQQLCPAIPCDCQPTHSPDLHVIGQENFAILWHESMQAFENSSQARYRFILN